jgi:hypothetical protein
MTDIIKIKQEESVAQPGQVLPAGAVQESLLKNSNGVKIAVIDQTGPFPIR